MSYKRIGSCIHNWSHSFLSSENYVDDDYTVEEIYSLIRKHPELTATFDPLNRTVSPQKFRAPRILKAMEYWCDAWPLHREREGVAEGELASFELRVSLHEKLGFHVVAEATDDRGKLHSKAVLPTL